MSESGADEELMARYCQGDATAFDTLYLRHKGSLYRYLLRQCGNAGTAEELFQDIWMKIVKARESYQPSARFRTFLFAIAHNRLIDHYRRQRGIPLSYDTTESGDCEQNLAPVIGNGRLTDVQADNQRRLARLERLIDALPEAQREAFLLQQEGGLSIEQIATATGVNPETAKSRVRYALKKLRSGLEEAT